MTTNTIESTVSSVTSSELGDAGFRSAKEMLGQKAVYRMASFHDGINGTNRTNLNLNPGAQAKFCQSMLATIAKIRPDWE
jgi:hypothetical protein